MQVAVTAPSSARATAPQFLLDAYEGAFTGARRQQ
jgi:hypothetical protein